MSAKGILGGGIAFVTIVAAIIYGYATHKTPPPSQVVSAAVTPQNVGTKATILRFDGFTPCEPAINFEFELDTQGEAISLKFPGIEKPLEYFGKGTIHAPELRKSGPVRITSLDSRKQARVRVWEVVKIQEGR